MSAAEAPSGAGGDERVIQLTSTAAPVRTLRLLALAAALLVPVLFVVVSGTTSSSSSSGPRDHRSSSSSSSSFGSSGGVVRKSNPGGGAARGGLRPVRDGDGAAGGNSAATGEGPSAGYEFTEALGHCDVRTGAWSPAAAAAEGEDELVFARGRRPVDGFGSSASALHEASTHPSWGLYMGDAARRQYAHLERARARRRTWRGRMADDVAAAASPSPLPAEGASPPDARALSSSSSSTTPPPSLGSTGSRRRSRRRLADDEGPSYDPLVVVDSAAYLADPRAADGGPASTTADAAGRIRSADTSAAFAWPFTELWPLPSFVSVGDARDEDDESAFAAAGGDDALGFLLRGARDDGRRVATARPIHAALAAARAAGRRSPDDDDAGNDPALEEREALYLNESRTDEWLPFLHPIVSFLAPESSPALLTAGERATVGTGLRRTCASLHAAWASRMSEAAAEHFGHQRDRGCDVGVEYGKRRAAQGAGGPGPRSASAAAGVGRRRAVLGALIIDVARTDPGSFPDGAGGSSSPPPPPPPSSSPYSSSLPIPYLGADESYSLSIRGPADGPGPIPDEPPLLTARLRAHTLWGALHGLETFSSIVEGWGVVREGLTGDAAFSSPTSDLLSGARPVPFSDLAKAAARAAAGTVADGCTPRTPAASSSSSSTSDASDKDVARGSVAVDQAAPLPVTLPLLIVDQPWRPWRGISLDTARHWLPVDSLLTLVDGLAASKLNVLHWHISDAQSYPLVLDSHPEIARHGSWDVDKVYTTADAARIVRYAARRGVRVVPEFDMPAHTASLGHSHPEVLIHCSHIAGGSLKEMDLFALDPSREETFTLLADIFTELRALFPDAHAHIGADEVAPECWASDERLRTWAHEALPTLFAALPPNSLSDTHATYVVLLSYFVHRVRAIVDGLGKRAMTWEDSFEKVHATQRDRRRRLDEEEEESVGANEGPMVVDVLTPRVLRALRRGWGSGGDADDASWRSPRSGGASGDSGNAGPTSDVEADVLLRLQRALEGRGGSPPVESAFRAPREAAAEATASVPLPSTMGPLAAGKGIAYLPGAIVEGWKCWVQHADRVILDAAEHSAAWRLAQPLPAGGPLESRFTSPGGGVIQASCWYLDWSSPWADLYRHWPLPESARGVASVAGLAAALENVTAAASEFEGGQGGGPVQAPSYPAAVFSDTLYIGGESAMWTERVDASNLACRVWPRAGVAGEILWSESVAYDRYARAYGMEPPFVGGGLPRTGANVEKVQALFAAPRYLAFGRRLLRRGVGAAHILVFDASTPPAHVASPLKATAVSFETDQVPFNGMCPGIEQTVQRNASRAMDLARGSTESTAAAAPTSSSPPPPPPRPLTFISYNVHDGGGSHGRYGGIIEWLREQDADVVGIVEANGWDAPPGGRMAAAAEAATEAADGESGEESQSPFRALVGEDTHPPSVLASKSLDPKLADARSPGWDELVYRSGHELSSGGRPRGLADSPTPIDTSAHEHQQTAGFRRRAASAGYPHAHLLVLPSGYHLALLSVRPMTVVYEDTEHFERGILAADVGGVRFVLVHLHAQNARLREVEAEWIGRLVEKWGGGAEGAGAGVGGAATWLPVVVLGDFNNLSPLDAGCHRAQRVADRLEAPGVPEYLRGKYMCGAAAEDRDACLAQSADSGTDATGAMRIDYRPLTTLLRAAGGLTDLTRLAGGGPARLDDDADSSSSSPLFCPTSYPTAALGTGSDDAGNDNGHVPLRIDFALVNGAYLEAVARGVVVGQCRVGGVAAWPHGQEEGAGGGGAAGPASGAAAVAHHLLELSDHLPLVCV
jgi:hypothetical protein